MDVLVTLFLVTLVQSVSGQMASCANTICSGTKECRIIQRCWGKDCLVGTTCMAPEDLPMDRSNYQCEYDTPALRSIDGGTPVELKCGSSNPLNTCPEGTECIEPAGVCCTGTMKNTGSCPSEHRYFSVFSGGCSSFCRHDQECPGFQRCCETGIGCRKCMDTVPMITCENFPCDIGFQCVMLETNCTSYPCKAAPSCVQDKPGTCPAVTQLTVCAHECKSDAHCQGAKKCCDAGGCNVCVDPDLTSSTGTSDFSGLPTLSNSDMTSVPNFGSFGSFLDSSSQTNMLDGSGSTSMTGSTSMSGGLTPTGGSLSADTSNSVQSGGLFPAMNLGSTSSFPSGNTLSSLQTAMQNMQTMMNQGSSTSGGSMTSMFGTQPSATNSFSLSGSLGGPQLASSALQTLSDTPQQNSGGLVPQYNPLGNLFGGSGGSRLPTNLQQQQQQQQRQGGFQCGFMCWMMMMPS